MIPKIEFDAYYKLNGINLIKLNISYCSNSKIDISIPLKITDNIDKYNSSSGYYNDICYLDISNDGIDIILKDRKEEFINNNMTVCQENCFFSEYDYIINKVKCSCKIKESSTLFKNIKIDKQIIYENFIDIKNSANINILKCYKVLFSKKGTINNYGNYFMMSVIITHFIFIIIFYINDFYNKIKNIIIGISFGIDNINYLRPQDKKNENKDKYNIEEKKEFYNKKIQNKENEIQFEYSSNKNLKNKRNKKLKSKRNNILYFNAHSNEIMISPKYNDKSNNEPIVIKNLDKIVKQLNKILSYNNEELNDLEYELALKVDKRKYCEYYYSLLKSNHVLIFTFCNETDYNSKIIKIDLLLFNTTLFFAVNTLFFNDDTMHKIYKNKGAFNIMGQLPLIIYSTLISMLFSIILKLLALTEGIILDLKKIIIRKEFNRRIEGLDNKIKIKFLLYFIISTIFLLFFWYYLSMFCAIYSNTQNHLIKETLLSFVLSLIEPFLICLIPGFFRIPAVSGNGNRHILYKLSKIFQTLLI